MFLKEELTFPYRYGLDFTAALLQAGGKEMAYAGVFKDPPKTTREIMEPETYLTHEKLEPVKMIDMEKDFKGYDPFDIGAMGEFDVDILVEQYAVRDAAKAMYPEWRGGYYFAGKLKSNKSGPIGLLYVSRWSSPAKASEFAAVYAKSLAKRYQKQQGAGSGRQSCRRCAAGRFLANLARTPCLAHRRRSGVIEVRGDECSSAKASTTTR
jgi:hypothetical protein